MADGGIARILSKPGYDPQTFVQKVSDGGEVGLQDVRRQVQVLSEETALALKRNVYKNYSQFIETAKEISILEGEMYQLSHMLTDQKNVLHSLMEMSITGHRMEGSIEPEQTASSPQEENKLQNLAYLLEKVEGCSRVTEVPGRHLLFNGDLVELEPESFTPLQKVHAFLLNDSLMLTTWLQNRRGPVKYKFQALYELDSLAVVNARDIGQCKNSFKILMFPDTRMYQAESPKAKRQWLDMIEETKKKKSTVDTQWREAGRGSPESLEESNPFADDVDEESKAAKVLSTQSSINEPELLHADWLQELPEDLDVCIAQRDFEGAVNLVERVNAHLRTCAMSAAVKEYSARIEQRVKHLTEVLVGELQVSPERSIRGGPRAARRAVTQLIRFNKSTQACRLFLLNRSAIIKYNIRQLKIEGATTLYMKKLSEVFFGNLHEAGREFIKAFPEHFTCYSSFVVWAKKELSGFMDIFRKQVFESKVTFTLVAECVHEAWECCNKLTEIGLDLSSTIIMIILKDLERMIEDTKEVQLDAVTRRGQEDLWRPVNFKSEEGIERFEAEMEDLGFEFIHTLTFDEVFTALTSNTIHFTKSYLGFCTDLLHAYCQELHHLISSCLAEVMKAQLEHVKASQANKQFADQSHILGQNGAFLVMTLLPLVEHRVMYRTGQSCQILEDMRTQYRGIKRMNTREAHV